MNIMPVAVRQRPPALFICPSPPESANFSTYWYRLPGAYNFDICTKCYEEHLHETPFGRSLSCEYNDCEKQSAVITCDFNAPRIRCLLAEARINNNYSALSQFIQERGHLITCYGMAGVKGGSGVKWFRPMHSAIPNFVACEACYEDFIIGSSFQPYFEPHPDVHAPDSTWSCELAIPFIRKSFEPYALARNWHGFATSSAKRMSLPACSGASHPMSSKKWFNTVRPFAIHDMTICEACFLDNVGWFSYAAQQFNQLTFSPYEVVYLRCEFSMSAVKACSDITLARGMYDKWHYFTNLALSKPECTAEGLKDIEWFMLPDPTDHSKNIENFEVCGRCHAGWNQSADWGHLFRPYRYPLGTIRICNFHRSSTRYQENINKWNEMWMTRNPRPFIDHIKRFSTIPVCQGSAKIKDANWYGDQSASLLICPECFEKVVRGTYFAGSFPLQNTLLAGENRCSLHSKLMRGKYVKACNTRSIDSLLAFAREREQVYQRVMPTVDVYRNQQAKNIELLSIMGHNRSMNMGAISLGRAFGGGGPLLHHYSPEVMTSTIAYNGLRGQILNDPRRVQIGQIEAEWKEVE